MTDFRRSTLLVLLYNSILRDIWATGIFSSGLPGRSAPGECCGRPSRSLLPYSQSDHGAVYSHLRSTVVTILRKVSGRAVRGVAMNPSHEWFLGMSEQQRLCSTFRNAFGITGVACARMKLKSAWPASGWHDPLTLLGVYLAGGKVYDQSEEDPGAQDNSLYTFSVTFIQRAFFEVLLDVVD